MRRLLLSALAVASVSCGSWRGSRPLPDAELLKGCKSACFAPNFCAHDGVRWQCLIVADKAAE